MLAHSRIRSAGQIFPRLLHSSGPDDRSAGIGPADHRPVIRAAIRSSEAELAIAVAGAAPGRDEATVAVEDQDAVEAAVDHIEATLPAGGQCHWLGWPVRPTVKGPDERQPRWGDHHRRATGAGGDSRVVGARARGRMVHIETVQPRRFLPGATSRGQTYGPKPGFSKEQYRRLAARHVYAPARAGLKLPAALAATMR